jgi:hypothetical protein
VGENVLNDGGVVDRGDQLHPSGVARTAQDIQVEGAALSRATSSSVVSLRIRMVHDAVREGLPPRPA